MIKLMRAFLALSLPVAVMALAPMAAEADAASLTITVGPTGTLLDPTLVRVPTEFICAPMEVATNQGSASLRQAVSGRIAFGSGFPETPVVCDGTSHAINYLIWVDTASPSPFARGNATVQINAFLCPPAPTPTSACQSDSSGVQVIQLTRRPGPRSPEQAVVGSN